MEEATLLGVNGPAITKRFGHINTHIDTYSFVPPEQRCQTSLKVAAWLLCKSAQPTGLKVNQVTGFIVLLGFYGLARISHRFFTSLNFLTFLQVSA